MVTSKHAGAGTTREGAQAQWTEHATSGVPCFTRLVTSPLLGVSYREGEGQWKVGGGVHGGSTGLVWFWREQTGCKEYPGACVDLAAPGLLTARSTRRLGWRNGLLWWRPEGASGFLLRKRNASGKSTTDGLTEN